MLLRLACFIALLISSLEAGKLSMSLCSCRLRKSVIYNTQSTLANGNYGYLFLLNLLVTEQYSWMFLSVSSLFILLFTEFVN